MSPTSRVVSCVIAGFALAAPAAHAGGLVLGAGQLGLTLTGEVNVSKDAVAKPLSLAPDVSYGVNSKLTVALVHSTFMATGFRGKAGGGLCLTGTSDGCAHVYDAAGVEALYAIKDGPLAVALDGGVHALSFDGGFYDVKLGAKLRYGAGKVTVTSAPSVFVALTERDASKDRLFVPVAAQLKVSDAAAVGLSTGLKAPFDGFGDGWELALGATATYAVQPTLTLGGSFVFGKLLGGAGDDLTGPDFRALQLWATYVH